MSNSRIHKNRQKTWNKVISFISFISVFLDMLPRWYVNRKYEKSKYKVGKSQLFWRYLYLKKNSNINVYERLLISQSNINCDKDTVFDINLAESPTVIFDNSYIRAKTLNIIGDSGNGKVNFKMTNITCKFVKVTDIEKISCDNSAFRSKELELKALNIIGFKPSMKGEMLKKIKILGRIQNSIILIDNLSPTKCEYDFDTCNGKITILYNDAIGNDVIQLSNCKLECSRSR